MRKKWILTSLLAIIMLPIIVIVGLLVFLASADLTQHRDFIAENISKITGATFKPERPARAEPVFDTFDCHY